MGNRPSAIVKANAPALSPRLWYGMPACAKDGKVVCHLQSAQKFNTRYATFGFSDKANLDEGAMWSTADFMFVRYYPISTSILRNGQARLGSRPCFLPDVV